MCCFLSICGIFGPNTWLVHTVTVVVTRMAYELQSQYNAMGHNRRGSNRSLQERWRLDIDQYAQWMLVTFIAFQIGRNQTLLRCVSFVVCFAGITLYTTLFSEARLGAFAANLQFS